MSKRAIEIKDRPVTNEVKQVMNMVWNGLTVSQAVRKLLKDRQRSICRPMRGQWKEHTATPQATAETGN